MPKIKIDTREFEFPDGLNLLDACKQAGYEIPHFCYHPALTIAGSCRMCQIEIEQGGRKSIAIACNTKVAEGMILHLNSEPTKKTQASVLEFLLLNHPLDCPICDDAGECKLQNYYMLHSQQKSRMEEPKWHKHKVLELGPNIMLDSERCILCSRCVRFFREIVGKEELEIMNSGAKAELQPLPGRVLNNNYAGNAVDLCPVGALTDRNFRFKRRVWYLKSQDSVCPGCSRGCNIYIHYDTDHNWKSPGSRIFRIKPRFNSAINNYWICDAGRYGYKFVNSPDRLTRPVVRKGEKMVEVAWDHAISEMANGLKTAISKENLARTAVLIAPQISTGALYLLKKLMEKMGVDNVDHRLPSVVPGELDHLLQMRDRNPNSFTAEILGLIPIRGGLRYRQILEGIKADKVQYLMAICCDPLELMEGDREALKKLKFLGLLHWSRSPGLDLASVALPLATFAESEGVFVNFQGRVQRFSKAVEPAGESKPAWQVLMMLGRELGYKFKVHSEAELFNEFASSYDMFKGLTWDKIGSQGQSGATI